MRVLATALYALTASCDGDTPRSPTTATNGTPTVADRSIAEDFVGTLAIYGIKVVDTGHVIDMATFAVTVTHP